MTTKNVNDDEIEKVPALGGGSSPTTGRLGDGGIVGKRAPEFALPDQNGYIIRMSDIRKRNALMLAFYPGDFTMMCTKQLCNYRDSMWDFERLGVELYGVSQSSVEQHMQFFRAYNFGFKLLSDDGNKIARLFGCTSPWMLGRVSRAVFIVNRAGIILYRYVEPTILSRRTSAELLAVVTDLKNHRLL